MSYQTRIRPNRLLTGGALVLAIASAVYAQEKPFTLPGTALPVPPPPPPKAADATAAPKTATTPAAEPNAVDKFFTTRIPEVIAKGKFNLNARLRYEWVDQSTFDKDANAPTVRTRFGYTTAPLYGFQGMLEGENITVIGSEKNYNAAGSNRTADRPIVADPPTTEVNRVFGDVDGLPRLSPNHDFDSDSHIVNISYSGWEYARFVGYSYLLDLQNRAGTANSCATYGGYVAGSAPVHEKVSLGYRGEFAYQTDYAESMLDYAAEYYNVELNATIKPVSFGAGYEVLGTDSNSDGRGSVGFKTPLATLHAFNGWADVFLTTPAKGLRDIYGFAQVTLPCDVPIRAIYHKYDADSGDGDFGWEFDLMASKKFGKYWTVLAKYAYYNGKDAAAGVAGSP